MTIPKEETKEEDLKPRQQQPAPVNTSPTTGGKVGPSALTTIAVALALAVTACGGGDAPALTRGSTRGGNMGGGNVGGDAGEAMAGMGGAAGEADQAGNQGDAAGTPSAGNGPDEPPMAGDSNAGAGGMPGGSDEAGSMAGSMAGVMAGSMAGVMAGNGGLAGMGGEAGDMTLIGGEDGQMAGAMAGMGGTPDAMGGDMAGNAMGGMGGNLGGNLAGAPPVPDDDFGFMGNAFQEPAIPRPIRSGVNLSQIRPWTSNFPFLNLMHTSHRWETYASDDLLQTTYRSAIVTTENDWPTAVPFTPEGAVVPQVVGTFAPVPSPGLYTLAAEGTGRVQFSVGAQTVVLDLNGPKPRWTWICPRWTPTTPAPST